MSYYADKNELYHWLKGSTKKNHKYTSRYQKNGRWRYVYSNKNIDNPDDWVPVNSDDYSKLEDWLGIDEYDNYKKYKRLEKEADKAYKKTIGNKNDLNGLVTTAGRRLQKETAKYLKEQAEVKLDETPIGKVRKGAKFITDLVAKPVQRLFKNRK